MALIDVVQCQMNDNELCKKFPSEDLRIGSQLVVYPSQIAFFVEGGQIYDKFESGTYTLKTDNLPLLNKIINLPFGKSSPFRAEVWFVNMTTKLDMKWGTPAPLQLEDPKYNIIVPIRAFGQYGIRVAEPETFLKQLIGNMTEFSVEKVNSFLKGKMVAQLNALLAQKISQDNISVLEINMHLMSLSQFCNDSLQDFFLKYGLCLADFSIMSINMPEDDSSFVKLKEAKDIAAHVKITGKDMYQMRRSFDVLETAAANQGAGGQMISMGAGVGMGVGVGSQMGIMAGNMINTNPSTPPLPPQSTYFLYIDGQQIGGQTPATIAVLISQRKVDANTLVWKQGLTDWIPLAQISELAGLIITPPSVPPMPHVQ